MPDALEDLLATYSPTVRELALGARALILGVWPAALERVHPGWKVIQYGRGSKMADQLLVVSPLARAVNIGFSAGATLTDPAHLLQGTGKSIRHVKLTQPADLTNPALRTLIETALAE